MLITPRPIAPAVSRRRLGSELRDLRRARSLRLEDVAIKLDVAPSTLSRIETGMAPTRSSYLYLMLDLYGIDDPNQRRQLAGMAREGQRKEWQEEYSDLLAPGVSRYLGLEAGAAQVCSLAPQVMPGLLQAADYAAAAHRAARPDISADQVCRLVTMTLRRQDLLLSETFRLHTIIDEQALRRPLGSAQVMTAQLRHLAILATSSQVTVQVLALATPWPVLSPSFAILGLADPADPHVACIGGIGDQVTITRRESDLRNTHSAFTAMTRAAMPPAESARLIGQLAA